MKIWKNKLTKKELRHLKEQAIASGMRLTPAVLKTTFEVQAQMRRETPGIEPCWTCKGIAKKLRFEV